MDENPEFVTLRLYIVCKTYGCNSHQPNHKKWVLKMIGKKKSKHTHRKNNAATTERYLLVAASFVGVVYNIKVVCYAEIGKFCSK